MSKKVIIIATIKSWNIQNAEIFKRRFKNEYSVNIFTKKEQLSYKTIKLIGPKYIFLPHWSWLVSKEICKNYECIGFHMTNLPFGRGGSPLQNLIKREIKKTKISAIRITGGLDAGPIYLKKDLGLAGSAETIFKNASKIVFRDMIPYIIHNNPVCVSQKGKVVKFQRRNPKQSDISDLCSLIKAYDYIRMLDAEGYPLAFAKTRHLKIEFSNAQVNKGEIIAKAKITLRRKS